MAVNAASPMLDEIDRASIGLLIVGTETGLDGEKPLSAWLHRYLALRPSCRALEIKNACYAATAGLALASSWVQTAAPGQKALVISTDQSRISLHEPWELVTGAGAAAMLVSRTPRIAEIEMEPRGLYTNETVDVMRPTPRLELGNAQASLYAYLEALEAAYDDYADKYARSAQRPLAPESHFARFIFHMPFAGMGRIAHRNLCHYFESGPRTKAEIADDFDRRVLPSLAFVRRVGATYGASTFFGLAGLLATDATLTEGDRIGMFAYGAGSSSELYTLRVGKGARETLLAAKHAALFDARRKLTLAEYEICERDLDASLAIPAFVPPRHIPGLYESSYEGQKKLVLRRVEEYVREYALS
jgi:hydroxymethylglutaryl-CoA synthase